MKAVKRVKSTCVLLLVLETFVWLILASQQVNCGCTLAASQMSCESRLDLKASFAQAYSEGLTSDTLTTCSRWAAHRRVMTGDFAGPYSWEHHPWVKEMHDSWTGYTWIQKAAQLGITEAAINRALYTIDRVKRDVLYVMPTMLNASDFSKSRFGPALDNSPYLKSIFTDTNAINLKRAGAHCLYIRGTRGDSNLKSIPVSELILDELDEMEEKQIGLAMTRLDGQLEKHVWGLSTPTVPGYGINKLFSGSTQEHFMFQCPHCSRWTELVWPDCVEIIGEHTTDKRCVESYLKCKECHAKLDHALKPEWLASAKWEPTYKTNLNVRGFYINQLYSFTVTPGELVVGHFRGYGDEFAAAEFFNSRLGLPFLGDGAKVNDKQLQRAVKGYLMEDERPERGNRLITLGVDQGKTNYAVVAEWLLTKEPDKDLGAAAICKVLYAGTFMDEEWDRLDELMREWQVLFCVIDADPQINEARRFARQYPGYVGLCRYRRGKVAKEIIETEDDTGVVMLTCDRTSWLTTALGRFKPNPPRIWLPRDIPRQFCEQVQNLVRKPEKDSHGDVHNTYVETGPDHFGHALCYAGIALTKAVSAGSQNIAKFM